MTMSQPRFARHETKLSKQQKKAGEGRRVRRLQACFLCEVRHFTSTLKMSTLTLAHQRPLAVQQFPPRTLTSGNIGNSKVGEGPCCKDLNLTSNSRVPTLQDWALRAWGF